MKIGNKRRTYLADALAKIAEYIVSLIILGSIVSGKIHFWVLAFGCLAGIFFMVVGMAVLPEEED